MNAHIIKSKLIVSKSKEESLNVLLTDRLLASCDDTVIIDSDSERRWTANEIYESCLNFAYQLVTKHGLKAGETVCFLTPNSDYHVVALLGVLAAGGIYSAISPLSPFREVNAAINEINPSFIIACKQNYGMAQTIARNLISFKKLFIINDDINSSAENSGISIEKITQIRRANTVALPIARAGDQTAAIFMTSGSTGKQKQVIRTNKNLIAIVNALQNEEMCDYNLNDVVMPHSLSHLFGFVPLLQALTSGATTVLMRNELWAEDYLAAIEKFRITRAFLIPAYLHYMIKNDDIVKKYDLSSFQDLYVGGSAITESVYNQMVQKFGLKYFRAGYGMTEVGWALQVYKSETKTLKDCKTVGRPVAGVQMKIIDDNGDSLPANSVGEICIKSDQVMPGYRNQDKENNTTFTCDGFLRSGDAGYYDSNGMFYIISRFKDIINVESEVVSPIELESVLLTHPAVEEAAVIGIEDEHCGEVPKAFVKLKSGHKIDEQSLQNFVNDRVFYLKRIRGGIDFVDDFPRTDIGKIKKSELKRYFNCA